MLNTTVRRRARRYALWASALLAVALVYGGCVSAPRPVPAGAEPVVQAQASVALNHVGLAGILALFA